MDREKVVPALDKFSSPKLDAIVGEMGALDLIGSYRPLDIQSTWLF